jgi:hypothetical protein
MKYRSHRVKRVNWSKIITGLKSKFNSVITHPKIAPAIAYAKKAKDSAINWFKTGPKKATIPVVVICSLLIFIGGWHFIARPIISGVSGIFSWFEEKEEEVIEINVKEVVANTTIDPLTIDVNAGEMIEFYAQEDEGFIVDGKFKTETHSPYSDKVFVQITTPDGEEYMLSDKITGLTAPSSGKAKISVQIREEGVRVWSGRNLSAKYLSEFERGAITLIVKRPKNNFNPNASIAKIVVDEKIFSAAKLKEQDKEVEEAAKLVRETFKKGYTYLFDRPLTVK